MDDTHPTDLRKSDWQWDLIPWKSGKLGDHCLEIAEFDILPQHNPVIKAFYERLVGRAKSKTLALTACVRKILVILNAMVRQNQPWQLPDNLD